ncbi:hypothetical protein TrST_g5252 [Triparma strigata]|uniref:Uncharacterized protein n=1 Tax=Triparma strigata TaxID=1606541 RepID=A0A9W6ZQC6_9STRA|nr:hypothetical protein TrST_g5252 [Triparma strigata]
MSSEVITPNSTEYNPGRRRSIGELGLEIEKNRKQEEAEEKQSSKEGADKYRVNEAGADVTKSERMRQRKKRRSSIGSMVAGFKNILG